MSDIMDNPWLRKSYQDNIKKAFKSHYSRDPIGDEAMVYAMASFFVDTDSPGYIAVQHMLAYAASIMKLWKTQTHPTTIEVLETMIQVMAQIIQVGVEEKVKHDQEKKDQEEKLLAERNKKAAETLSEKLLELPLKKSD
jgi:hypothetical protein